MPVEISAIAGEDLATLAGRVLGDSSQFRELAQLNGINPLEALPSGLPVQVPTARELAAQIEPALTSVVAGTESALLQVQGAIAQVQGYTAEARRLVGDVNGVLGQVDSELNGLLETARQYQGEAVRLVDWLLDKAPAQADAAIANLTEAIRL